MPYPASGFLRQLADDPTNYFDKTVDDLADVPDGGVYQKATTAQLADLDQMIALDLDDPEPTAITGAVAAALSLAGLAAREVLRARTVLEQTGAVTIRNRAVREGLVVSKNGTGRGLNYAAGSIVLMGRELPVPAAVNAVTLPDNSGAATMYCYAYLLLDANGIPQPGISALVATTIAAVDACPSQALVLYRASLPAGNTAAADANAGSVTLTDLRRLEAGWPQFVTTEAYVDVVLPVALINTSYAIDLDLVTCAGSQFQRGSVYASDKATNGFKIKCDGGIDDLAVRWTVHATGVK